MMVWLVPCEFMIAATFLWIPRIPSLISIRAKTSPSCRFQKGAFKEWDLLIMSKTLCEMKKLLKSDFVLYKQFVCNASHVCTKCGRAANDKKLLCKPERLKD